MLEWTVKGTLRHAKSQQRVHDCKGEEKSPGSRAKAGPSILGLTEPEPTITSWSLSCVCGQKVFFGLSGIFIGPGGC